LEVFKVKRQRPSVGVHTTSALCSDFYGYFLFDSIAALFFYGDGMVNDTNKQMEKPIPTSIISGA